MGNTQAKGSEVNSLTGSKNVDIKVAEGATLDSVKLVGKDVKANVNVDGKIENLLIEKKADVKIKGTTQTPVNVTSNAAGAVLGLSTAANLTLNENAKVNVAAGAKIGSLTVAKDATVNVEPKASCGTSSKRFRCKNRCNCKWNIRSFNNRCKSRRINQRNYR